MSYEFLQAKYYSRGRGGKPIQWIFIHTMETPETPSRAKQVWKWFAGKTAPQASAHFMVDATNVEQSVMLSDTAWAVNDYDTNQKSISIELSGEASQTPEQWADAYSTAELKLAAKIVAQLCKQFNIPVKRVYGTDIQHNRPGIAGHWDVTLGKAIKGGHTDPGVNFPWTTFIPMVEAELTQSSTKENK